MLETDYLILGAGAMSMSFADVILTEDPSADIVMVDRRPSPGGHWNDAYPYVRLHQPAAFYGLNSTELGQGGGDLTSGPEIVAYYTNAMDRFRASGRVRFLPMTEHREGGELVSLMDPARTIEVRARRRVVDGTYMHVEVPATTPPRYPVDDDAALVTPNALTRVDRGHDRYVVIGAGKTGIDAILFLLDHGADPGQIQWVMPNDAWLWDRASVQPGGCMTTIEAFIACAYAGGDAFAELERRGIVFRLDPDRTPSRWRCATVDRDELAKLRSVHDVVRLGRVTRVRHDRVELARGSIDVPAGTLFVDCTANGLARRPAVPVFGDGRITLQSMFMCQQTFSAAVIAHLELLDATDARRNRSSAPVPHPESCDDLAPALAASVQNVLNLNRHSALWLRRSRLFTGSHEPPLRYLASSMRVARLQRRARAAAA